MVEATFYTTEDLFKLAKCTSWQGLRTWYAENYKTCGEEVSDAIEARLGSGLESFIGLYEVTKSLEKISEQLATILTKIPRTGSVTVW